MKAKKEREMALEWENVTGCKNYVWKTEGQIREKNKKKKWTITRESLKESENQMRNEEQEYINSFTFILV